MKRCPRRGSDRAKPGFGRGSRARVVGSGPVREGPSEREIVARGELLGPTVGPIGRPAGSPGELVRAVPARREAGKEVRELLPSRGEELPNDLLELGDRR